MQMPTAPVKTARKPGRPPEIVGERMESLTIKVSRKTAEKLRESEVPASRIVRNLLQQAGY